MLKVEDVMSVRILSFQATDPIARALEAMSAAHVHHAPVVDHRGRLVGMLSDRDLLRGLAASSGQAAPVATVMSTTPRTVAPDVPLGSATSVLLDHDIHALAVVDHEGALVGMLSTRDLLVAANRTRLWSEARRDGRPVHLRRILAGLDDSPNAAVVLHAAAAVAGLTGAELHLHRAGGAGARDSLEELARQVPAGAVKGTSWGTSDPTASICGAAREIDADLVVVGAVGHRSGGALLGSTAGRVANQCDRSVLIVRCTRPGETLRLKRVLVAVDASEQAGEILGAALDLAVTADTRIVPFRVMGWPADMHNLAQLDEAERSRALVAVEPRALRDLVRDLPMPRVEAPCAGTGVPWEVICAGAERLEADLVVIGAGRTAMSHRFLGSTASRVVEHARRSVLVVRSGGGSRSAAGA